MPSEMKTKIENYFLYRWVTYNNQFMLTEVDRDVYE